MKACTHNLRSSDPRFQALVNRMTSRLKMRRIRVYASDTANACATYYNFWTPIIAYNPTFLQNRSYGAIVTLFAHEVAHHYNIDVKGNLWASFGINKLSHRRELNADWFAGWILRCEGATLADAVNLYQTLSPKETYTHPGKAARINAVQLGWESAECGINPPRNVTRKVNSQLSNLGHVLIGAGLMALVGFGMASIVQDG